MKTRNLLLAASCGILFACSEKDYYDPNYAQELYANTWENKIGAIDPNQDWNMFSSVAVKVTVNEDLGQTYTVKLYTANPLDKNSGAMLIAQSDIKSGETYESELKIPKTLNGVYVSKTDKKGSCMVKYATITDNKATASFGLTTKQNRSYTGKDAGVTIETRECPFSQEELKSMIEQADELDPNMQYHEQTKNIYKVTTNKNYNQNLHVINGETEAYLIVTNGATLTLKDNAVQNLCIIVENGTLKLEEGNNFPGYCRTVILKEGKVIGEKLVLCNGSDSNINYNAGSISIKELNINGAYFYNNGNIEVEDFASTSYGENSRIINQGWMQVTGTANCVNTKIESGCDLDINNLTQGSLTIGDNAYVKIRGRYQTGGNITIGKSAVLDVNIFRNNNNLISAPTTNSSTNYSEHAFIKFNKVDQWDGNSVITGYYVIDAGDYNNESLNPPYANWEYTKYAVFLNTALGTQSPQNNTPVEGQHVTIAKMTIPEPNKEKGECAATPLIDGNDNEDNPMIVTYAFEDLGSIGDYDFNDVVLQVAYVQGSQSKATVTLAAIGGIKPVTVLYNNTTLWKEVHEAYQVSTSTMVNTGNSTESREAPEAKEITLEAGEQINNLNFSIAIVGENQNSEYVTLPKKGKAPQALCIPYKWKWPLETVSIIKAYGTEGHAFGDWNNNVTQGTDWYMHPIEDQCYPN